ncbi:hypothetical protein GCM10011571_03680 [Marinithermofilum abyssi]|uniref:Regulatory protein YycH-like domain-containing protein n=1 Tax=Marinithermofilum abyssi TaxID=1571185 RepID=A0A8J2VH61_9BACL|nr:two-component system regulatory protein YycI [Marinithermofilum abyssi]GGE05824.1 hypothetical protein GCM10011571_03680 [Marinithermofilum abyssi]
MDWSRAKTILILAFLALNLFLSYQLFQARGEQSQTRNITENTQEELEQLAREKNIHLQADIPQGLPQVTFLEARTTRMGKGWRLNPDGSYTKTFHPAVPIREKGLEQTLRSLVAHYDSYRLSNEDSTKTKRVYYQMNEDLPLFDARMQVDIKDGRIQSVNILHFTIKKGDRAGSQGVNALSALISLIEKGQIDKGDTVTHVKLGYHGQSYDAKARVLPPVWRIETQDQTYYVNALTGSSEIAP